MTPLLGALVIIALFGLCAWMMLRGDIPPSGMSDGGGGGEDGQ
jgi:hypothetical protein